MARGSRGAPAYRHVDVNVIPEEVRQEILEDADTGGKDFGLTVVEIAVNGAVQSNIYGVYAHDEPRWLAAKNEFGINEGDEEVDLTAEAQAKAEEEAAELKLKEQAELEAVASGNNKKKK